MKAKVILKDEGEKVIDVSQSHTPFAQAVRAALKDNVKGKTVLDVGGYDGAQAKWCLDHGATSALCIDDQSYTNYGWETAEHFSGVEYINRDFYDFDYRADVVIFQNVIYHQRNPWMAMERIRSLTRELLVLSTSYIEGEQSVWEVYSPHEGHPVSWTVAWRPTVNGMLTLLRATGFTPITHTTVKGHLIVASIPTDKPIGFGERC